MGQPTLALLTQTYFITLGPTLDNVAKLIVGYGTRLLPEVSLLDLARTLLVVLEPLCGLGNLTHTLKLAQDLPFLEHLPSRSVTRQTSIISFFTKTKASTITFTPPTHVFYSWPVPLPTLPVAGPSQTSAARIPSRFVRPVSLRTEHLSLSVRE